MIILIMKTKYLRGKAIKLLSFLFITAVFFSFSFPGFCQEDKPKEEKKRMTREAQLALVESQRAYEKEDYEKARKPLLDYLATQPETIPEQVYLLLGVCWYFDKNIEEAIKVFKKAHEAYPENVDILKNYAAMLSEGGHHAEAAPLMEKVYDIIEKKDIKYLNFAVGSYYQAGKLSDAKRVLMRMIDISEKPDSKWFESIISICMEQDQLGEAESFVLKGLGIFPMDVKFWKLLGNFRQEENDYAGATGAYEIGSRVKPPEKKDEWKTLINLYQYLNVPLRVASTMIVALKKDNVQEDDHIMIADAYSQAMRVDEAISYLDKIIAKKPSTTLMLKKAKILLNARRNEQAIKALDELIAIDPDEGEAYMLKGLAAWDLKDWKTMEAAFRAASRIKGYKDKTQAKNFLGIIESLQEAKRE